MKRRKIQKVVSLLLILIFLGAGLPFFIAEDANKDNKIDLKDVILNAQHIKTGNETVETCISAMQVVAHLKNISASSTQSDEFSFLNLYFLLSATDREQFLIPLAIISNSSIPYTSIISPPVVFPPILS
ncbi:MAG: hypothetical protein WAZ60_09825 [Desulfosalsimonadaceae bacterium]